MNTIEVCIYRGRDPKVIIQNTKLPLPFKNRETGELLGSVVALTADEEQSLIMAKIEIPDQVIYDKLIAPDHVRMLSFGDPLENPNRQ